MPHQYDFLTQSDYYDQLIDKVESTHSGDRIAISSMAFDPHDPRVKTLLAALGKAARRRVTVHVSIDGYAFMFDDNYKPTGPLVPHIGRQATRSIFQEKSDTLDALAAQGVVVGRTNIPTSRLHLPYAGRSHIKGAVVNDQWGVGGCNLGDTDNLDAMVGGHHPPTADYLYHVITTVIEKGSIRAALGDKDILHPIDKTTRLLIDIGTPRQSLIYSQFLEMIDTAEEWFMMTCQFFPSGATAKHLAQATRRGVDVHVFYNSPTEKRLGGTIMELLQTKERLRMPHALFKDELEAGLPFLHAKIAASEKGAIIGSHNLISAGVTLGTAEVAIHSTDPLFIHQAGSLILHVAHQSEEDPTFHFLRS